MNETKLNDGVGTTTTVEMWCEISATQIHARLATSLILTCIQSPFA